MAQLRMSEFVDVSEGLTYWYQEQTSYYNLGDWKAMYLLGTSLKIVILWAYYNVEFCIGLHVYHGCRVGPT